MVRNFGLDVVRSISIWLVLMQHAHINIPHLVPLRIGLVGVEFFFVLSGFLIGSLLFKTLEVHSDSSALKEFWIRRWLRTLPLYYFILIFRFIFIDRSVGSNIGWYFVFLQNNFYGVSFFDVSWSLVIEEWFYLLAPIPLLLIFRVKKAIVPVGIGLFILLIIAARMWMVISRNTPYEGLNSQFLLRFDALFIGVLLAWFKSYSSIWKSLCSHKTGVLGVLSLLAYLFFYAWAAKNTAGGINATFFPRTLGFTLLPILIAFIIPWMSTWKEEKSAIRLMFFTQTSILTYGIYLIHPMCFDLLYGYIPDAPETIILLLGASLSYIGAYLAYRLIELPVLRLRDKYFPASYRSVL